MAFYNIQQLLTKNILLTADTYVLFAISGKCKEIYTACSATWIVIISSF
jgi:hypothetical protein